MSDGSPESPDIPSSPPQAGQPSLDATSPPAPPYFPRSSLPTTLGVFNIFAAVSLMLMGLCCGGYSSMYLVMFGQMIGPIQITTQQAQQQIQQRMQQQIDELEAKIEQSEDEQQKKDLRQQRDAISVPATVNVPTEEDGEAVSRAIADPTLLWFIGVEVVSGLLLNLLLLVAGIGLISRNRWGLKWSQGACWLKIGRLLVLYLLLLVLILPQWGKGITDAVARIDKDPQTAIKAGQATSVIGSSVAVAVMLLGMIYPGVMLWALKKPEVAADCNRERPT